MEPNGSSWAATMAHVRSPLPLCEIAIPLACLPSACMPAAGLWTRHEACRLLLQSRSKQRDDWTARTDRQTGIQDGRQLERKTTSNFSASSHHSPLHPDLLNHANTNAAQLPPRPHSSRTACKPAEGPASLTSRPSAALYNIWPRERERVMMMADGLGRNAQPARLPFRWSAAAGLAVGCSV